jgi:hypothetical protein
VRDRAQVEPRRRAYPRELLFRDAAPAQPGPILPEFLPPAADQIGQDVDGRLARRGFVAVARRIQ